MSPHMAVVVILVAIALGILAGVTAYECRAARDEWAEFEAWERLEAARNVTGRADR